MKKFCFIVVLGILLSFAGCVARNSDELVIVHVNDTHSHLDESEIKVKNIEAGGGAIRFRCGGIARLASFVDSVRNEKRPTLVLHAGDVFSGTLYFTKFLGEADCIAMNAIGFDAMVPGNHEFDKGPELLAGFSTLKANKIPLVAANLKFAAESPLQREIRPYIIKKIHGVKVGIIGLVTPDTANISFPGENLTFLDPVESAGIAVKQLTDKGVTRIIALTHQGYAQDIELAKSVPGIDIIVGGHSHTLLGDFDAVGLHPEGKYPTVIENGDPVLVVQAWEYGRIAGRINVRFDKSGKIVSYEGKPQLLLSDRFVKNDKSEYSAEEIEAIRTELGKSPVAGIFAENQKILTLLDPFKKQLESMQKEKVAQNASDLPHVRIPGELHSISGRNIDEGSHIAPVVAESFLWKGRTLARKADIALVNAGGVRVDVPKGDITVGKVYELLPFGNTLVLLELSGAQIKASIEEGIEKALNGGSDGAYPYVAGLKYTAEKGKPAGERIVQLDLVREDGTALALDMNAKYLLVTQNYVAAGGDGYRTFADSTGFRTDTGFTDAEVFMEYLKKVGSIETDMSGRALLK